MPIPDFNTNGILPAGFHDCDLSEIAAMFVYNNKREKVWETLAEYLKQISLVPQVNVVYVDGSFVTNKALPGDVDLVLEFNSPQDFADAFTQQQHLFNHPIVKQIFNVDMYFAFPGMPNDFREFFQYLRTDDAMTRGVPAGTRKGILKISLNDERQRGTI